MTLLFAGGAEISVPSLTRLSKEHTIAAVLTHPDTTAGRGRKKRVNPVKEEAQRLGIPVIEAEAIDDPVMEKVKRSGADLLAVVAYGKLFPKSFLKLFPRGGMNLHPSLLPRYRGPSPATAAILNGDRETGITIQRIAYEMDTGDIVLQQTLPVDEDETTGSLLTKAAFPGAELMAEAVRGWESGSITPVPQNEKDASYCRLIRKEDGRIDWREPAPVIERKMRAYDPWPRTFTEVDGLKLMILEAAPAETADIEPSDGSVPGKVLGIDKKEGILIQTGNGVLAVRRLQMQSKKALDWRSFINGNQHFVGSLLGQA